MCGLAGIFRPDGQPPLGADLQAMARIMRHRGPDGTEIYRHPDDKYHAIFNRLAIIDLETGDQPIVEGDGRRVLMGNGEIYNYIELRRDEPNYAYQTKGDMEVILPLASRHGLDFVEHLEGMYALALYDAADHQLTLVRDRFGIKPLYWTQPTPGGAVIFASEIKAIFAAGLIKPEIDVEKIPTYLAHGYVPAPATIFKGIHKLPPAHHAVIDRSGNMHISRYWRADGTTGDVRNADEAVEQLDRLLSESVAQQLRSDVPVGALLSGGLDSGLIVAHAARQSSHRLKTFTVRFQGAVVDESPLAEQVAQRFDTDHSLIDVAASDVAQDLPRLAWHMEEPSNDAATYPNYLIERELGANVKVALNGTGGDEIFAGYGRYFQTPIEKRYLGIPSIVRRGLIEPLFRMVNPQMAWKLSRSAKFFDDGGAYLHQHTTFFSEPMRNKLFPSRPAVSYAQSAAYETARGDRQSCALIADIETYLPEDLLHLLDRTSMAVSVEGRVPFLNSALVESALRLPEVIRAPDGQQKWLERKIAAKHLPEDLLHAPKQGFASPVPAWMHGGLAESARHLLTRPASLDRGWWSIDGVNEMLRDPMRYAYPLYALIMLELTTLIFVENDLSTSPPAFSISEMCDV